MKTIAIAFLLFVTAFSTARADDCRESFTGATSVLNSYTDSVRQCLNRYSEDGPIASQFDQLLDQYSEICVRTCDSQRARLCQRMVEAKNRLKAVPPYECTR